MVVAYIFVNMKSGSKEDMNKDAFMELEGVKYADLVYGAYDVVLCVEVPEIRNLTELIKQLRKRFGVENTTTMISVDRR